MKIYHGTNKNFKQLDRQIAIKENQYEFYGMAIYFTDNIDIAKSYGNNLWILDIKDDKFETLNAKNNPIRILGDLINKKIQKNLNIKVINVADAPRFGNMYISINYSDYKSDKINKEYPYLDRIIIPESSEFSGSVKVSKQIKNKVETANKFWPGLVKYTEERTSKYERGKKVYYTQCRMHIDEQYRKDKYYKILEKSGFKVLVQFGKLPAYATTYIITDDELLRKAKIIKSLK